MELQVKWAGAPAIKGSMGLCASPITNWHKGDRFAFSQRAEKSLLALMELCFLYVLVLGFGDKSDTIKGYHIK